MKFLIKLKLLLLTSFLCVVSSAADIDRREIECLTKNVYFESRGEPVKGQLAVIFTTLNRAKHKSFPNDVCKVVYQKNQFSWVRNKPQVKDWETYRELKQLVQEVVEGKHPDVSKGALYFHANTIRKPKDFGDVKCTARIGDHIFYK